MMLLCALLLCAALLALVWRVLLPAAIRMERRYGDRIVSLEYRSTVIK